MDDDNDLRLMMSDLALIVSYLAREMHLQGRLPQEVREPIAAAMDQFAHGLDGDEQDEATETAAILHSVALLLGRDQPGSERSPQSD